jgi:UDP-N-acetylglucosamine diphosphorylase/glucosamine-1-phosphate N-acetyltransferase
MLNIILFDSDVRDNLLPFTFTRPISEIRIGILTIREKWERLLHCRTSYITQDYLAEKYPIHIEHEDNYVINGSILPTPELCRRILQLNDNECLLKNGELIASKLDEELFDYVAGSDEGSRLKSIETDIDFKSIQHLQDIFRLNEYALQKDFELVTKNKYSQPISQTNRVFGAEKIFIEKGAKVECSILNATNGPIYIGKNAEIMENCTIRGGLALCEGAILKMGAKIYGSTTIGPYSRVGGEVKNTVIFGNSNKGHEGYLGDSVLGEWCNLGADTNNSNLKNNYSNIKLWSYPDKKTIDTGLQFCGLMMGDHAKSAINTMFNTGTVVGVAANVFGAGFPPTFIPDFTWGVSETYRLEKAIETASLVMARRDIVMNDTEKKIFAAIFQQTETWRK